jgi:hypothetical protein
MAKIEILLIICFIGLTGCINLRHSQSNKKQKTIERFDLLKFNKSQKNNVLIYSLKDGTVVKQTDSGEIYLEERKKLNSPFTIKFVYYKSSLLLKGGGTFFYNNPMGTFKEYDDNGKLIREINYDSKYAFSIQNLIEKVNHDYNIDLNTSATNISINRYVDDVMSLPEYALKIPINENSFRYVLLNGNTGGVIKDVIGHYIE